MWRRVQSYIKSGKFYLNDFFDIEFSLKFSFQRALEEMHLLAYVYHWDRNTLWKIPCRERRLWVDMIQTQKKLENNSIKSSTSKIPKPKR